MKITNLRERITLLKNLFCSFLYNSGLLWIYNKYIQRFNTNYVIIIVYHNIRNKKLFSKHIEYFKQKFDVIQLDEAIELLSGNKNFNPKLNTNQGKNGVGCIDRTMPIKIHKALDCPGVKQTGFFKSSRG